MKLLVLGNSSIFRRRVLPGLAQAGFDAVDVCSASGVRCQEPPPGVALKAYADYAQALAESDAGAVYISTHNSLHGPLAMDALASGRHVAVDKPAFASQSQARQALTQAEARGLVLAEANVWPLHPRAKAMKRLFREGGGPTRLQAAFSFPPLPAGNFRLDKRLGGGALADLGPYAVSPGRFFFGLDPVAVSCTPLGHLPQEGGGQVETSFACMLRYPGGRSFTGVFGFDTGYVNSLEALGPGLAARMNRAFTPPPDLALTIEAGTAQGHVLHQHPPANTFALFFAQFAQAIRSGDPGSFAQDIAMDADALARLTAAASEHTCANTSGASA